MTAVRRGWLLGGVAGALLVAGVAAAFAVDGVRWRLQVVYLVGTDQVEDLTLREALPMLKPGSGYWLKTLPETRSPFASIRNPLTSAADVLAGGRTFARECAACHGANARGTPAAPALVGRNLVHGDSDWALLRTIERGVSGTAMKAHPWPLAQIWPVVAYLRSINTAGSAEAAGAVASTADVRSVPFDEIRSSRLPGADWLTYSGTYSGVRHSALAQIDRATVGRLAPRWLHQFDGVAERIETSPIVRDGVMFVTYGGNVAAIDARDGRRIWEFARAQPADARVCCGVVNRGVAILGDRLYVATIDAHLLALSARTGRLLWDVAVVDDYRKGYAITSAPLVVDGLVITGIAGGDFPTRGFIAAFDAVTGAKRWHFKTIPEPGEPGNDTWAGNSWQNGGGATWLTGSYDHERGVLYWGVGNPAPDFDASGRRGDNLYTCSVVALEVKTGRLLWHFQFTPNDDHDWDSAQVPVLVDRREGADVRPQMLWANRNGFFYVLDRTNGRFLRGAAYVHQTWALGLDPKGRPIRSPLATPTRQGVLLYPSASGATNWWSPTYDPDLDLMLVPTLDRGGMFFSAEGDWAAQEGEAYLGGRAGSVENLPGATAVVAIDPSTGNVVWRSKREVRTPDDLNLAGLMSTAGGLTFGATNRDFYALDTRTGEELWTFHAGGRIASPPVTYLVDGTQYVAVSAGRTLIAFALVGDASVGPASPTVRAKASPTRRASGQ